MRPSRPPRHLLPASRLLARQRRRPGVREHSRLVVEAVVRQAVEEVAHYPVAEEHNPRHRHEDVSDPMT